MKATLRLLVVSALGLAFALLALAPLQVHSQTVSTGAIAGIVTDPSGATIPFVNITATEKATAFKRVVVADASGSYRFSLLPSGDYQLRFEAEGFTSVVPPNVRVAVTEISTL